MPNQQQNNAAQGGGAGGGGNNPAPPNVIPNPPQPPVAAAAPPRRSELFNQSAALIAQDRIDKLTAGVPDVTDRHSALAVVIDNQIQNNSRLQALLGNLAELQTTDLSFVTAGNAMLKEARDSFLDTVQKKTKLEAHCSALPNFGNKPGEINGKNFKCFVYSGNPPVPSTCQQWLDRFNIACEGKTKEQWFALLKMYSEGDLLSTLSAWESEGHTDPQVIIPWIERLFGGLIPPTTARRRLSLLEGKPNETITAMDVRITALAKMATLEDPPNVRQTNLDMLRKTTLLRMVPAIIRNDFTERELARTERGDGEFSYRETVHELQFIVVKYDNHNNRKVNSVEAADSQGSSALDDSDPEDFEETLRAAAAGDADAINYINFKRRRSFNRSRNDKRAADKSRRFPPVFSKGKSVGRLHQVCEEDDTGEESSFTCDDEVLKYDEDAVYFVRTPDGRGARIYSAELNVERDACFKCGKKGHKMSGPGSDSCPYKNEALHSRCSACNCGGHRPEVCQSKN